MKAIGTCVDYIELHLTTLHNNYFYTLQFVSKLGGIPVEDGMWLYIVISYNIKALCDLLITNL